MSEIIFGTPEHVAGLSRKALEEDFQWVNDRRMELEGECERLDAENDKMRELVRGLHMAYVGALNECEGMDEGLIWEHCEMVDAELAKSHARFEVDRHRFDVAMRELGIEVDA